MFSVTTTSSACGPVMSFIEAVSTSMCSRAMAGWALPMAVAIRRHSREDSRTLALSTLVTFFFRPAASSKASFTTRSISKSQYSMVSKARSCPSFVSLPFWPK